MPPHVRGRGGETLGSFGSGAILQMSCGKCEKAPLTSTAEGGVGGKPRRVYTSCGTFGIRTVEGAVMVNCKLRLTLFFGVLVLASRAPGAEPVGRLSSSPAAEAKNEFLRVAKSKEGDRVVALETAIVRYGPTDRRKTAPTVDLIAAVHIADKAYYERLNREFAGYDVVLYELIAPEEGAKLRRGTQNSHGVLSSVQSGVGRLLNLEFQLDHIDYTQANMVHADMSPNQFAKSMKDRGESFFAMFMRAAGYGIARQSDGAQDDVLAAIVLALFSKDRALALKRLMAEQFGDMEGTQSALDGPKGSTMIAQRNKVALEGLRRQIAAGKKKIAVFYGAAHLPDMQKRLRNDFGLIPRSTRWLAAWDLNDSPAQ